MGPFAWVAGAFGVYDPETAVHLDDAAQRRLLWVGLSCLLPCGIAAAGMGYAADLIAGASTRDSLAAASFAALATLTIGSLIRITMAGSGIAPHVRPEQAAHWRPKHWPTIYLAAVGAMLAQPLVVLVLSGRLDGEIAQTRNRIAKNHATAVASSAALREQELLIRAQTIRERLLAAQTRMHRVGDATRTFEQAEVPRLEGELANVASMIDTFRSDGVRRAAEVDAYRAHLATCAFLAERIRRAWSQPLVPVLLTALAAGLTGLPLLLRHRFLGAYAQLQHRAQRAAVSRHAALVERLADQAYRRTVSGPDGKPRRVCPSYAGPPRPRFADPPFQTEPLDFFGARVGAPQPTTAAMDEAIEALLSSLPE